MEILILQYALAVLICIWWIKPFKTLNLNKNLKISLFNFLCIGVLFFIGSYTMLHEFSEKDQVPGIYTVLFHFINMLLFLAIPAGYLYLRSQLEQKYLVRSDLVHLLPFLLYVSLFVVPWFFRGSGSVSKSPGSRDFFSIYAYCTMGVYILLILKFLLYKYLPFLSSKGSNRTPSATANPKKEYQRPEVQVGSVHFDAGQLAKMDDDLKTFFLTQQPFLKQGYNLKQLSEDTAIPLHHLSAFINQYYHIHFNDFINEYRVQYCQVKIRNDEWRSKTLEAIAEESGFNNRNTFTAAFKKSTGHNPSDFLKIIKRQKAA